MSEAINPYERALAIWPGWAPPYYALAEVWIDRGDLDQALRLVTLGVDRGPRRAQHHLAPARKPAAKGNGVAAWRQVWSARRRLGEVGDFLALGLIVNVGLLMLPGAARYGGVRLILPAFPFLIALGTLMAARVSDRLVRGGGDRRLVSALVAAALLAPGVIGCVRYYPYCLSYYAEPLGLRGAVRLGMDATYYGDAFAGARDFMAQPEHLGARFYVSNEPATAVLDALIIAGEIPRTDRMLGRYVTDRIPPDADWVIVDHHPPMWPPPVVELMRAAAPGFTVSRDGVWLVAIYPGPQRAPKE
jgi:tetratricopeptide (TPR) repeat protein